MTADEAAVAVIDALESAGVSFMIVGSIASNFHGIPRSTRDADFLVHIGPSSLNDLTAALPPGLSLLPQGSFETVTGTMRHVIVLERSAFICELFVRGDDSHDEQRFARRQKVRVLGRDAFMASAEDMIITKLRWATLAGRNKDRDDARNMIAVRGDDLDWNYIRKWCGEHGTLTLLDEIRASIPPL
jgi:hypothetical protein